MMPAEKGDDMNSKETGARKHTVEYLTSMGALVGFVTGMLFDQILVGLVVGMALGALIGFIMQKRG